MPAPEIDQRETETSAPLPIVAVPPARSSVPAPFVVPPRLHEPPGSRIGVEFAPTAIPPVATLVKLVGSIVTVSPLEISIAPLLVNVVGSINSVPPLEAAVIVPLLMKELPPIVSALSLAVWLIFP